MSTASPCDARTPVSALLPLQRVAGDAANILSSFFTMSTSPNESGPSPVNRERLQQIYAHGNKQMLIASFDYANTMFSQCVLGDPGNVVYFKTFLANLKKKFGDKKKKGMLSFLSSSSIKKSVARTPDGIIKAGVEALASNPWDADTLLAMGGACEELGHHDVAVEYYRSAVEAEPGSYETNHICCKALREIAAFDEALGCALRMLKIKPADQIAEKLRKDITVEKTIHKGKYAMGDSQQVRDTVAGMRSVVAEDEDVMGRALTYVEQVERRIKKNPNDVANFMELAQYFYQAGDYEQAEKYYTEAVRITKNEPDMVERLLDTQKQKFAAKIVSLPEDSQKFKEKALELKAKFEKHKTAEIRDEFYKVKEQYDKAKKELETVQDDYDTKNMELARHRIQFHPNHAGYHFEYGVLLQKIGETKDAIAEFQLARADITRKGDCMFALGQCFEALSRHKLAMDHYREAISELPATAENKKEALYLAMHLAIELKDKDTAEKYGNELAAIDFSYKDVGELLDKVAQMNHN